VENSSTSNDQLSMNASLTEPLQRRTRIAILIATGGYSGYAGVVPGTVGSAVGVLLFLPMAGVSLQVQLTITAAVFALGVWASSRAEEAFKIKDAGPIVIDEIVGMWISLLSIGSAVSRLLGAFFLFRFFDVVKPFPAKRAERLKGGLGVMVDDVIAGIYAKIAFRFGQVLINFVSGV